MMLPSLPQHSQCGGGGDFDTVGSLHELDNADDTSDGGAWRGIGDLETDIEDWEIAGEDDSEAELESDEEYAPFPGTGSSMAAAAAETPELSPEACFTLWAAQGRLDLAEEMLNQWRRDNTEVDIKYYKMLMRGYLRSNRIRMARRTFRLILSDHDPDLASYMLIMLCHGIEMGLGADVGRRLDPSKVPPGGRDTRRQIRNVLKRMRREGHHPSDVYRHMVLTPDERRVLLRTIHTVMPDFEPSHAHLLPSTWHRIDAQSADATKHIVDGPLAGPAVEQWKRETATIIGVPVVLTDRAQRNLDELVATGAMQPFDSDSGHDFGLPSVVPRVEEALAKERASMVIGRLQRQPGHTNSAHDDAISQMFALSDTALASIVCAQVGEVVFRSGGTHGVPLTTLAMSVGQQVFLRYFVESQMEGGIHPVLETVYPEYARRLATNVHEVGRDVWEDELEAQDITDDGVSLVDFQWSERAMIQIGTYLIDTVIKRARLCDLPYQTKGAALTGEDALAEALFHTYDFRNGKIMGVIKAHPALISSHGGNTGAGTVPRKYKVFRPTELPMLTMPKPWRSVDSSPYLATPATLIRCRHDQYQHLALLSKMQHSVGEVYDALNYLGACPWKINTRILDYVMALYKTGEGVDDLAMPAEPTPLERISRDARDEMSEDEWKEENADFRKTQKEHYETMSLHADLSSKLCIAAAFRNDVFYLPHNMDFRGRAYTVPPHLSHIGGDMTRALLRFGDAKPLGERGLYWLKVHLANLGGVDKVSFEDRVQHTDANMDLIFDSAIDPFGPPLPGHEEKWWRAADAPWQTLAACIELHAAMQLDDPTTFVSSLPVHQDGTCNGLQHYAALGGDVVGAVAVNLSPLAGSDKPQDVYMQVVDRVNGMISAHVAGDFNGINNLGVRYPSMAETDKTVEIATHLATLGPVGRKTVKQTIMTSVYGVTFIGARAQILKQLKPEDFDMDKSRMGVASLYLAACTFSCLDDMFKQAHEIKSWLQESAYSISKTGMPVTWLTPMNLPVIQPYHKMGKRSLPTSLQTLSYSNGSDIQVPANPMKQRTAFPPNFVHSLDSCHMMYTANACNVRGIRFVSVHDSFWSHASTVDDMNVQLREQFVRLHSQPLLPRLYEHFNLQHNGQPHLSLSRPMVFVEIPEPPQRGQFDITDVLRSPYFFN